MAGIRVQAEYEELIQELTSKPKSSKKEKIFPTIAHFFIFAGAFGYQKQKKIETKKARQDTVIDNIFDNAKLQVHIYAVALAEAKTIEILKDKDICYKIFENYVNGGLEEINKIRKKFGETDEFVQEMLNKINTIASENVHYEPEPLDPDELNI